MPRRGPTHGVGERGVDPGARAARAGRRGRCVLILSGWAIEADPEAIFGSGSVNIGDANVTADGATGGFVPPTPGPLELETEDEVWAVARESHPNQVITWIELFD
jgi:hypothetical protein